MRLGWRTALVGIDAVVARTQRKARLALGRHVAVRIMPYRGWVAPNKAVVLARAIDADLEWERMLHRSARLARVLYERFATVIRSGVEVRVSWEGMSARQTSDSAGFVDVEFPLEGKSFVQTTAAELSIQDTSLAAAPIPDAVAGPVSAEVLAFDQSAPFGIISDIDDTVLETELSNPWKRGLQLVYSEQRMRLPFDGIAALYQAFATHQKPVFYVSNAPWNLYPHVAELLDHNQIPKGPLLLRDSAFSERITPHPELGHIVHKQRALRRIVQDYPKLPFVLLGDSSRRDAQRYVEIAEAFPGRVAAIYIRRVRGVFVNRESLDALQRRAERVGVEFLISDDTVTIAEHARSRGFLGRTAVGDVREGKRQDEQAPPAELTTLIASPAPEMADEPLPQEAETSSEEAQMR